MHELVTELGPQAVSRAQELIALVWPYVASVVTVAVALLASGHAVLFKRDVRASLAWVAVIWFVPIGGAVLYLLLGINRIRRRAAALQRTLSQPEIDHPLPDPILARALAPEDAHLSSLALLVNRVVRRPLTEGNSVTALVNGDAAYPSMLQAIREAERSVSLCTYIFDHDQIGEQFVDALVSAHRRKVAVRVLVDAVGARYSPGWRVDRLLRRHGVPAARFLPPRLPWRMPYMNLRNHRKLLTVDGRIGFTGGMNIRVGHVLKSRPRHPTQDTHFRFEGPVVGHFQDCFAEDWRFTTGEQLEREPWFPPATAAGATVARGIADGPDEDFEKLRWAFHGALACARSSIRIVTPYFLPDSSLITFLGCAALRGVSVDVVLPEQNNLTLIKWASTATLWQILEHGCRVWLTPPPFDHSKVLVVDDAWVLVGSGNWDPRSLRLNFEFDVECYDRELASRVGGIIRGKIAAARELSLDEVDRRSVPVRLRDGVARLVSPYL